MSEFSLELNEDQLQLQKWVHDFAENVVRPAAHEWDEREETPWPIIEEAAEDRAVLARLRGQCFVDPTGLSLPLVIEEMAWGDAGINLAIFGTTLAVAGIFANGTPEQVGEWLPQCFGTPDEVEDRRLLRERAGCRLGRELAAQPRRLRRGARTSGCSTGPRRGSPTVASPTSTWWWPRSTRRSGRAARPASSCPRARRGSGRARSSRRWASAPATPPRWCSRTCRVPGPLPARRQGEARRAPGPGPGGQAHVAAQAAMATFEASRPTVGAQAVGIARAAYEYSLDYAKEREQFGRPIIENQAIAFKLADMRTRIDAARLLVCTEPRGWRTTGQALRRPVRARCRSCSPGRPRCG